MPKLHPNASSVRVQSAMEPEDVLWENLGNPFYEKGNSNLNEKTHTTNSKGATRGALEQ